MNSINEITQSATRFATAIGTAALLASTATLAGPPTPLPDFTVTFPAGVACEFPVQIDGSGGQLKIMQFVDRFGNLVQVLAAGTGSAIVFTNLDTGATFQTRSNGSVQRIIPNADGSFNIENMGNTVIILFDTDTPPGPSTTLYAGRVVIRVDNGSVLTVLTTSGTATDICAAVSP